MQDAHDPEVGELEDAVHDPHQVRQEARPGIPRSHQHRDVSCALVIGQYQGPTATACCWLVAGFHNWKARVLLEDSHSNRYVQNR